MLGLSCRNAPIQLHEELADLVGSRIPNHTSGGIGQAKPVSLIAIVCRHGRHYP